MVSSNLPCLDSTFHLENPLVLSRFCFEKPYSPSHDLDPYDHVIRYFYRMFPENCRRDQHVCRAGSGASRYPRPSWTPTDPIKEQAFIGLWMFIGINRLPTVHMYWPDNTATPLTVYILIYNVYCYLAWSIYYSKKV